MPKKRLLSHDLAQENLERMELSVLSCSRKNYLDRMFKPIDAASEPSEWKSAAFIEWRLPSGVDGL